MYQISCLLILLFSKGLTESIPDGNNVTLKLKAILKLKNDTDSSNLLVNIKNIKSERRNLDYLDNNDAVNELDFPNFIKQSIRILKSYDDKDIEDVFAVIDEEVRKYKFNGKTIKAWARSSDTLKLILKKFEIMKEMSGRNIRRNLDQVSVALQDGNFDENVTKLIHLLASLYDNNGSAFSSIINDLQQYKYKFKRSNVYLSDLVKNSLTSLVFDPYKNLEHKNKKALHLKMDIFLKKPMDVRTNNQEHGDDDRYESTNNFEFIPELKVRETITAVDRLKKNHFHGSPQKPISKSRRTKMTTKSPIVSRNISPLVDVDIHFNDPQNHQKHNVRQRLQNIDFKTSDIVKNEDLLGFILSLLTDSHAHTATSTASTAAFSSQNEVLMNFFKALIKSVPSKKSHLRKKKACDQEKVIRISEDDLEGRKEKVIKISEDDLEGRKEEVIKISEDDLDAFGF